MTNAANGFNSIMCDCHFLYFIVFSSINFNHTTRKHHIAYKKRSCFLKEKLPCHDGLFPSFFFSVWSYKSSRASKKRERNWNNLLITTLAYCAIHYLFCSFNNHRPHLSSLTWLINIIKFSLSWLMLSWVEKKGFFF